MHICPHCGQPGIGILRKHFIGAAVPATCKNCGEKVFNDNKKALIAVVPFIVSYVGSIYINNNILSYFLIGVGVIVTIMLTSFWVPLKKANQK